MPTLNVTRGPFAGRQIEVAGQLIVGRQGADVTLDDPEVSRRHAAIRPAEGALEIEDLGSTNGTWVNGAKVEGVRRLMHGDVVRVGGTTMEVVEAPVPERAATRAADRAATPTPVRPSSPSPLAAAPPEQGPQPPLAPPVFAATGGASVRGSRRGPATRTFLPVFLSIVAVVLTAAALILYFWFVGR